MPFRDSARENSRFYRREFAGKFSKAISAKPSWRDFFLFVPGIYINSNSGEEFVSMRHQPFNMSSPPPPSHRSSRLHSTMCRALFHVAYTSTLSCLLTLEQNEFRRVCWCTAPPPPPRLPPSIIERNESPKQIGGKQALFCFEMWSRSKSLQKEDLPPACCFRNVSL